MSYEIVPSAELSPLDTACIGFTEQTEAGEVFYLKTPTSTLSFLPDGTWTDERDNGHKYVHHPDGSVYWHDPLTTAVVLVQLPSQGEEPFL